MANEEVEATLERMIQRADIDDLFSGPRETYSPRQTIIADGQPVKDIHLVLSGLAARSKDLASGGRQIMAFLIPGDLCDVEVLNLGEIQGDAPQPDTQYLSCFAGLVVV